MLLGSVIISCKSEDYAFGHLVYDYLIEKGVKAFFADQELRNLGLADYGNVIDHALDSSKHLIVVASSADFTKEKYSPYVYYEWKTFSEEKRSGRKTGNILTVVPDKSIVKSLPIALRNVQSFTYNEYQDVYNYVIGDGQTDIRHGSFHKLKNFFFNLSLGKKYGCAVSIVLFVFLGAVLTPFFILHKSADDKIIISEMRENADTIQYINLGSAPPNPSLTVSAEINLRDFEPFIYFVKAVKMTAYDPGDLPFELTDGKWEYSFDNNALFATGFITEDGYFYTARQIVEPWAYFATEDVESNPFTVANILHQYGARIEVTIVAESSTGDKFELNSDDFTIVRHNDVSRKIDEDFELQFAQGYDFAYKKVNVNSTLVANAKLSHNLKAGTRIEAIGFPHGLGGDNNSIQPLYTFTTTTSDGLLNGEIPVADAKRFEPGNVGGPVFVNDGGSYYVVGLITFSSDNKYCIVAPSEGGFLR